MHITMPFTVHYTPTQRATTPTLTSTTPFPYHDAKFKENITPSPPLNVSQPSPKVRNQSLRKRNRMSSAQLARLESLFRKDTHPSRQKKKELADELGLSYRTLTVWLQNKRQTVKRNGGSVPSPPSRLQKGVPQAPDQQVPLQSLSVFKSLSPPSMDNALRPMFLQQVCSEARTAPSPVIQETVAHNSPPKKSMVVKPLLSSLGSFIAPESPSPKASHGNFDQAQSPVASRINAEDLWRHLSSSPASPSSTSDGGSEARDGSDTLCHKRCMTLEWACDRQVKQRRGASHRSDTEGLFWGGRSSQSISSALSLLSFATGKVTKPSPAEPAPSPDVMRGASLLLSFKHSSRGRNAGKLV